MKVWNPGASDDKFELTSMIDVVFLLIAFFMTVTSFASSELIQVKMPVAPQATVPEDIGNRQFLSISENGTYFLGAFSSDLPAITAALEKRKDTEGFKGAYIRADASAPYKYVSDLMKACKDAGVYNILFGTVKD